MEETKESFWISFPIQILGIGVSVTLCFCIQQHQFPRKDTITKSTERVRVRSDISRKFKRQQSPRTHNRIHIKYATTIFIFTIHSRLYETLSQNCSTQNIDGGWVHRLENGKKMRDMWTFNITRIRTHCFNQDPVPLKLVHKHTFSYIELHRVDRKICAHCRRLNTCLKWVRIFRFFSFYDENCKTFNGTLYSVRTMEWDTNIANKIRKKKKIHTRNRMLKPNGYWYTM